MDLRQEQVLQIKHTTSPYVFHLPLIRFRICPFQRKGIGIHGDIHGSLMDIHGLSMDSIDNPRTTMDESWIPMDRLWIIHR